MQLRETGSDPSIQRVRASSGLGAEFPGDWGFKESITVSDPDGQANVIASSEPVEGLDTERFAAIQGQLLASEFRGYRELTFEPMRVFGGRPGFLRKFEWEPPEREPVTQMQIYCVVGDRGLTATATTSSRVFADFERELGQILESLSVELAGTPSRSPGGGDSAGDADTR